MSLATDVLVARDDERLQRQAIGRADAEHRIGPLTRPFKVAGLLKRARSGSRADLSRSLRVGADYLEVRSRE